MKATIEGTMKALSATLPRFTDAARPSSWSAQDRAQRLGPRLEHTDVEPLDLAVEEIARTLGLKVDAQLLQILPGFAIFARTPCVIHESSSAG